MIRAILLCQNGVTADFSACVSKYRKILWVDRNRCCGGADESQPDILLLEAGPGRYPRNFQADILLIAKDVSELRGNTDGMMRKNGIAVFDPARFEDISFLRTEQLTAVTCGINEKNTISVSSIHDDSIILTLFRELKGVFGQKLEMQEYLYENIPPVQDVYTAMLACALILLTTPEET